MDANLIRTAMQEASSYLRTMGGTAMVVHLPGNLRDSPEWLQHLADLALLHSLNVRLVIVFTPSLDDMQLPPERMDASDLRNWMQATADTQASLCATLPRALPGVRPPLVSSNIVSARPAGVVNGEHSGHLGEIRQLNIPALRQLLDIGCTVLVPSLAPSLLGTHYVLDSHTLAMRLAIGLQAKKLILLTAGLNSLQALQQNPRLSADELRQLADTPKLSAVLKKSLLTAAAAGEAGVERVHLLDTDKAGVLIAELYTRQGAGALVTQSQAEQVRQAHPEDAAGLLQLIEPMEREGILVKRDRDQLERDIDHFLVLELENKVIGCCALLPHGDCLELAALAIEPRYRREGRAAGLLEQAERTAANLGAKRLLVLTTVAEDWFLERGFVRGAVGDLPESRAALYNYRRNSVILTKQIG